MDFSIVFPAFNEQENLPRSVEKANKFLKKKFKSFEIIVVNDGSTDDSSRVLKELSDQYPNLRTINKKVNSGYGGALRTGLDMAKGRLLFFTDSDLQFDINELGRLLKKIKDYDVVIGYRVRRAEGFMRLLNMKLWSVLMRVSLKIKFKDIDCAFKLFKATCYKNIKFKSSGAMFSAELLYNFKIQGCDILEMPVNHFKRLKGKPTGSNFRVILKAFKELREFKKR